MHHRPRLAQARATLMGFAPDRIGAPIRLDLCGVVGEGIRAEKVLAALSRDFFAPVEIRLDSEGGSVEEALKIYNALRRRANIVSCEVGSRCSSAGILILLGASYRVGKTYSRFLIHAAGFETDAHPERWDASTLRRGAQMLDNATARMAAVLADRCDFSDNMARRMLAKETRFDARHARDIGLVHAIA